MIKARLKYLVFDPDRNGNPRYYVRLPGQKKIRIRESFQDQNGCITEEFMSAYRHAVDDLEGRAPPTPALPKEHTFYWLVDQYFRSELFKVPDRGSVNPTPLGGLGQRHFAA
jgi:hypothetical protein